MTSSDLLVEARRRAGISQEELARRLKKPQSTVSRWEGGAMEPSFAALRDAIRACDLDLDVSLARADDSYVALIRQRLSRRPLTRLSDAAGPAFEALLLATVRSKARFLLAGSHAAAVHGSPVSPSPRTVLIPDEQQRNLERLTNALTEAGGRPITDTRADAAFRMLDGTTVVLETKAPGTRGYRDLARDARRFRLDGAEVSVVSILDLLRIADASGDPEDRLLRPALQKVLEVERATTTRVGA